MGDLLTNIYFLVIMVGIASATGDAFFNYYAKQGSLLWFIVGCLGWIVAAIFFTEILKQQQFGPSVALFVLGNISIALIVGRIFFKDNLAPIQWGGVALAVVAILLMVKGK